MAEEVVGAEEELFPYPVSIVRWTLTQFILLFFGTTNDDVDATGGSYS